MGESTTLATGEFVAIAALRERAGVTRSTLRRRLKRRGVPVFLDPSDERARLVRRQDADRLLTPRPWGAAGPVAP